MTALNEWQDGQAVMDINGKKFAAVPVKYRLIGANLQIDHAVYFPLAETSGFARVHIQDSAGGGVAWLDFGNVAQTDQPILEPNHQ